MNQLTPPADGAAPRGRPRSSAADAAILAAARELLAEQGWPGLTVEAVAARAGVAKTTVYRRWSSRADLAIGAVAETMAAGELPPAASATDDVRQALRTHADVLSAPEAHAAYLAVVAASASDAELHERFAAQVLDRGRRLIIDGVARAEARGEVRPGIDVDLLHDLLAGALVHRVLIRGQVADDAFVDALVELLQTGTAPPQGPGTVPR